jgi:Zn-dependent protease/CBS domain-containing protein
MGIPIKLDITFLVVLVLFTWLLGGAIRRGIEPFNIQYDMRPLQEPTLAYTLGFAIVIGLFVSVLIHELGHAVTARAYGVRTRSITLWLLGGVAQLEGIPRQRGAEAVVAIVGPIVSLVLGAIFWGIYLLIPDAPQTLNLALRYVTLYLALTNVALAVFNLLPALPLDGGRVLRSLLALKMNPLQATQISGGISKVLAIALGLLGFMGGGLWLMLVAFFIYMAVNAETQQTLIEYMLRGIGVRDLMNRDVVTIAPDATVQDLMTMMVRERHLGFPVVQDGQIAGMIDLSQVQGAPPETPIAQLMQRKVATIDENAQALDAFTRMGRSGFGRLVVVDREGRMVGIISKTDLMRAIQIRVAATSPRETAGMRDQVEEPEFEPSHPIP